MKPAVLRTALQRWSGFDLPQHLPQRIARQIALQRQKNDLLVGWVQATVIGVFATLYAIAPKTSAPDAPFHPVPWAIGVYLVFTATRLWMAYRAPLPRWMHIASSVVDIAILMVTIWSFHIQYMQPAAFYLKAPTLMYVFIFIALRGLSVHPLDALFCGILAAAGWVVLLLYALMEPGAGAIVTHDYVAYINSMGILIGGEVDKIISILLVAVIVTLGVTRSRRLLYEAVADQAAASELSRFFSPDVARQIVGSDESLKPGDGRAREAAVMFVDLRGFTRLASRIEPGEVMSLLADYQSIVVPVVSANRGSITTFLGDGVMITFGAVQPGPTYAADALRCAQQLLDAMAEWSEDRKAAGLPELGVGIGVAAGTVIVGVIGDESRLEFSVIGDTVNRASKLQNHTKVERVTALATALTLERAVAQGYAPDRAATTLPGRQVAGVDGTMDLVVIR